MMMENTGHIWTTEFIVHPVLICVVYIYSSTKVEEIVAISRQDGVT